MALLPEPSSPACFASILSPLLFPRAPQIKGMSALCLSAQLPRSAVRRSPVHLCSFPDCREVGPFFLCPAPPLACAPLSLYPLHPRVKRADGSYHAPRPEKKRGMRRRRRCSVGLASFQLFSRSIVYRGGSISAHHPGFVCAPPGDVPAETSTCMSCEP